MASEDTPGTAGSDFQPETPKPARQPESAERREPESAERREPESAERREITVRRAPRYVPFLILGGLAGMAVAAAVAFGVEGNESYDPNAIFGFFLILFGAGGVILGAVVALVLDRSSVRRAQHAVVEAFPENEPENAPGTDTGTDTGEDGQPGGKS